MKNKVSLNIQLLMKSIATQGSIQRENWKGKMQKKSAHFQIVLMLFRKEMTPIFSLFSRKVDTSKITTCKSSDAFNVQLEREELQGHEHTTYLWTLMLI